MLDKDIIRSLIRDVIAEEVKHLKGNGAGAAANAPAPQPTRIATDADLAAFASHVLRLAADPKIRAAIEAGRHPFRLIGGQDVSAPVSAPAAGQSHRIESGVVTETMIAKLPAEVRRLLLGPGVSITPLARDRTKARNISVERIRQ